MRRLQKILLGIFLGGVLLGGIGTGVAFVEYSSITYAGEKKIGQDSMVTKELDFSFDSERGIVKVAPIWYDDGQVSYVETDETVPEDTVRYRITYNEKMVTPSLYFSEYDEDEEEELMEENLGPGYDDTDGPDESGGLERSSLTGDEEHESRLNVIDAVDSRKKPVRYQGELHLRSHYRDDFGLWMENKDEILSDLKQGRLASYRADTVTDVKVFVNPASMEHIKEIREY